MEKLLIICGPTAAGKTKLALHLAKIFDGELVSVDSRQVYKGMDIGTGKDLPANVKCQMSNVKCNGKKICYYKVNGAKIWGYDLVEPTQEFSVGQYIKIARKIINDIWSRGRLPILVGGTGLYIRGVVDGISTASIPKNIKLREILEGKKPSELFEILTQFDPGKAASMNMSDKKNARRLIRAIEIAQDENQELGIRNHLPAMLREARQAGEPGISNRLKRRAEEVLFVGLKAEKKLLDEKIEKRVNKRVNKGIEDEIKKLFAKGVAWKHQAMSSLGYKQWQGYFEKLESFTEKESVTEDSEKELAIEKWKQAEKQYAKRQMTWFTRNKRMTWFDITKKDWQKSVEKLVKKWYSSDDNGKANKN